MRNKIKLAVVGRPNVGKSALFNRICQKNIAIVDEAEGVTRDRLYAEAEAFGKTFQVIDTAGIDAHSTLPLNEEVKRQAEVAIEEADTIVMVVDAHVGITTLDEEVARVLLRTGKPLCIAVNKVDDREQTPLIHQFHSLGISRLIAVSATHGFQVAELIELALAGLPFPHEEEGEEKGIRVAVVGRPNVGKSTLINQLLQEERCVVSPTAGTTRDSIDSDIVVQGERFTLVDTAGIRRKRAEHEAVDKFAAIRTERAIERANVCVLVLDAQEGLTAQEKRIACEIEAQGKGCVILINKWDLVKGFRMEHCLQGIRQEAPFLGHCPTQFISAKTGRNLDQIFQTIQTVHGELGKRITTGQLNTFVESVLQKYHPPMIQGRRLRIYYLAQVGTAPPRFVLFVNHPELMVDTYKKYLINQFREAYGFLGAPLVFDLKGKRGRADPSD
jgi:GTP-binding protein